MGDITVTLCNLVTGQSESIPVSLGTTIAELNELAKALLGMEDANLVKDGRPLSANGDLTLAQAGVQNGDLLAAVPPNASRPPAPAAAPMAGGGLDFSNLLASSPPAAMSTSNDASPSPVYFAGMTLVDAVDANPHPAAIVQLLQQHSHLFKELNHHNPTLAQKLLNQPYERAVQIWREDMVKGSVQNAFAHSQAILKEREFQKRLQANPNDVEAKEYFEKERRLKLVRQQYMEAMQEYPESMGRVLMLYIEAKINNQPLQAFVDSGAQTTIMSKKCAAKCGILDLVDTRFAGVAIGVGTGKILGRIHIVQLQIGDIHFPCSVTIMDDSTLPTSSASGGDADKAAPKDMDFLLGLDMLKRHTCCIDLERGNLRFRLAPGQYMETPFLHEKDLDESKGGTKGFNVDKANEELEEAWRKQSESGS